MSQKRPRRPFLVGFDTEDDGKGSPFLFTITHENGSWYGRTRSDALVYFDNLARDQKARGRKVEAWATNLEYDLANVFDPDRAVEVAFRFGRNALCGARWRGVEFRDTMRHVPISVEAWGEFVGLAKAERGLFRPGAKRTDARFLRRAQRDATITFRAADLLHQLYRKLGERPRMTLASTALKLWESRYFDRKVRAPSADVWDAALEAYHGGRTQAFAVGGFDRVSVIDVASMFPWAMTSAPLPLPWGLTRRVGPGAEVRASGLYRVEVRSALDRPRLPVRTRDGTIYPNGTWVAWYVGEELQSFARVGGAVRVLEGIEFVEEVRPFDRYVATMFRRKQRARGAGRTLYKLLLNSLYGKFGQQGKQIRAVPIAKLPGLKDPPLEWRAWNGLAIYSVDAPPPPWGNNVWPAWITARARVRLADEIDKLVASGCRPIYCDTDSVMFQGAARYASKARRIGQFEIRGVYDRAVFVGKKEYMLKVGPRRWECHAKGVPAPQRKRYLLTGHAEFDRPVRIRESARVGLDANVWRGVEKTRRKNLSDSARPDGSIPVPVLTAGPGKKTGRRKGQKCRSAK